MAAMTNKDLFDIRVHNALLAQERVSELIERTQEVTELDIAALRRESVKLERKLRLLKREGRG